MTSRIIRITRPRKLAEPAPPISPDVFPVDDGGFVIGLEDETSHGPFPSRQFAAAVAADQARRLQEARQ